MSTAVVNDWKFKEDANIEEAMNTAAKLVEDFKKNHSGVQLSLWLKNQENPLHYWHITVFETKESLDMVRKSEGIKTFVEKFYPYMDRATHNAPTTDVVLLDCNNLKNIVFQGAS